MFVDDVGDSGPTAVVAAGVLLLFVGVAMLSSRLVRPLAALVGLPARRAGGAAGRLASGNAVRNPSRTAATAAALMIGIALVSFVATLTNGMKASNREAIEEQVVADYVVTASDGYSSFPATIGDALSESSTPEVVTHVRSGVAEVNGDDSEVSGIEPEKILSAYVFDWTEGGDEVLDELDSKGAIVTSNYAEDHDLGLGRTVSLLSASNRTAKVQVVGVYRPPPFYPPARQRHRLQGAPRHALRPPAQSLDLGERRG